MKTFLFVLTLMLVIGCSTQPKNVAGLPDQDQQILNAFEAVDRNVLREFKSPPEDLKTFNKEKYDSSVMADQSPEAASLREYLREFQVQEILTSNTSFAICAFSAKYELALCDDPSCPGIEYFEKSKSPQALVTWKATLPKKGCAKGK